MRKRMRKLCGSDFFGLVGAIVVWLRLALVPRVGIEPTLLAERDFESLREMAPVLGFRAITSASILPDYRAGGSIAEAI
jgi:hypothetical protein